MKVGNVSMKIHNDQSVQFRKFLWPVTINRATILIWGLVLVLAKCGMGETGFVSGGDNRSPRAVMEEYVGALIRGDPQGVPAAFDQSTKEGRIASQANQKLAATILSVRDLEKSAKDKFGDKGVKLVDDATGFQLGEPDEKSIQEFLKNKMKIYMGEDQNSAVAHVPGFQEKYVRLIRKGDKWFVIVDKQQAVMLAMIVDLPGWEKSVEEVRKILARTKTLKELEVALEEFKRHQEEKK
jgi:hypothetical protein